MAGNTAEFLKADGHEVVVFHEVEGAVARIVKEQPDLAILDVMFPECDTGGFDMAREISQTPELKALPIILLSGVNQHFPMGFSKDDIDPDWMPVRDFVEKPFSGEELCKKVKTLLGSAK